MDKKEIIEALKTSSGKEAILLRGRLISLIKKELKHTRNEEKKMALKTELFDELKLHKESIKERSVTPKKLPLNESISLKIKDIKTTINIFMEKHDIVNKLKSVPGSVAKSGLVIGLLTAITSVIKNSGAFTIPVVGSAVGTTLIISDLVKLIPVMSYIGLSNIIRLPFTDSKWSLFMKNYENKDKNTIEMVNFINGSVVNNSDYLELQRRKINNEDNSDLININEQLVSQYDEMITKLDNPDLKQLMTFEKINVMKDLKKNYHKEKRVLRKIGDKVALSELEKKSLNLDIELFKDNGFIKDVSISGLKKLGLNAGTTLLAKSILSTVFPGFAFNELSDVITPFLFSMISSISEMNNIKEGIKIRQSAYDKSEIKISNPKLFNELTKEKQPVLSM